jgi:hypothetical integral membrane protein (TIGR02206 family)
MTLETFGPAHLAIVAAIPLAAWALAASVRGKPSAERRVRVALAVGIALNELVWYGYTAAHGELDPPSGLPLDLCDVVLWLTVYALLVPRAWALEAVYYLGLGGSGMAVLTPDVGTAPAYPVLKYFLAHGAIVAAVLLLVWTGALRPRPGSWWRVFLGVNAYAAFVALVNARYGTNYMYLRRKPESGTLLDLLGPWPWYVLGGEVVALLLLWAMQRPFRHAAASAPRR